MRRASFRVALIAALATAPRAANAQARGAERLPLSLRARPLTLPAGTVAIDGALSLHHERIADATLTAALALGAAWAPTDDVELTTTALPIALSPQLGFGVGTAGGFVSEAGVGIRWRLVRRVVQGGFALRATFRRAIDDVYGVEASVPFQYGFSRGRIDLEVGARLGLASRVYSRFWARPRLALQIAPQFSLAASAGVVFDQLGDDAHVPASLAGVYTLSSTRGAPTVDVSISLEFERLFHLATGATRPDIYTVAGALRFFVR